MNDPLLFLDKKYIPELLKEIKNEQLSKRLAHELYTYANRAVFYKKIYYILTFATIICPALILVTNVFSTNLISIPAVIVGALSSLSSIAAGILAAANIRDNWLTYRSNCELLKEEVFLYTTASIPYDNKDPLVNEKLFIEKVFTLYHNEYSMWKANNSNKK